MPLILDFAEGLPSGDTFWHSPVGGDFSFQAPPPLPQAPF